MSKRRLAAVLALMAIAAAIAVVLAAGSSTTASKAHSFALGRFNALHEGGGENGNAGEGDAAEAATQAYSDRAYPADGISINQIKGAIAADNVVEQSSPALTNDVWNSIGPNTLNVDRLGTQAFNKATQWSGRVTALAVDPKCRPAQCRLYVAAAGGGVWRSTNALSDTPLWQNISSGIPTNAIGSIAIDPNDTSGKTIYVGTGEANASGDSEAGLGLYKSTDGGDHWSLVPGSFAAANNRSIAWVAIQPGNANHILIGTRSGTHGLSSNGGGGAVSPTPAPPAVGVYNSTDGGTTFALTRAGSINEVKFDPLNANTVYAAQASTGLIRSMDGGVTWETIFSGNRTRYSFAPVVKSAKTRIYLADSSGSGSPSGAQVYRIDDASQPAATLTASSNAAWTRLSNPTDGTPGFAVYNYCNTPLVGSQCVYDEYVMSPPDNPDMVVVGGLMHYEELRPYVTQASPVVGARSNGRAVLMSTDAGATWTDMTGDVGGESMHPDQHALAFVPGNPSEFFAGSDGGVIRTSGEWADASSQCDSRGLTAPNLADCKMWLAKIPTELKVLNAGLGTLQMNQISVNPASPANDALSGTQDNGTLVFSGSRTWFLPLTGDGGDNGFDAADRSIHFHMYTGGQIDVNYNGNDPATWLWIGDKLSITSGESFRFYSPAIADPVVTKTIFVGGQHVWRTTDLGGDRTFLEQHCNTAAGEFGTSDQLFTGNCGTDWFPLGGPTLTSAAAFGGTRSGGNLVAVSRGTDHDTLWASTSGGRVFVSQNANNADPASVTFTRIDTTLQPTRVPVAISVDPTNPNHAIIAYSGYNANTPTTPGHVFDVVFNPTTGLATWTDLSNDLGDQPINDVVFDSATGDVYASTDFTVLRLAAGAHTWTPASTGLPQVAVSGLTLATGSQGVRWLYAATHGRGAYRVRIPAAS
jgi:hypothetical protein